jgi:hypothetical protein
VPVTGEKMHAENVWEVTVKVTSVPLLAVTAKCRVELWQVLMIVVPLVKKMKAPAWARPVVPVATRVVWAFVVNRVTADAPLAPVPSMAAARRGATTSARGRIA